MDRRNFMKMSLLGFGGIMLGSFTQSQEIAKLGEIPKRPLGKTGLMVSLLGLGGFNISLDHFSDQNAVDFVRYGIDHGINFLDNAREYNDGLAERRMGKALRNGYREKVILMTKNCGHERDYAGTMKSIEESLQALQTDYIDLMLFHEVCYPNDPEWIFQRGGMEAMIEARKQGKIRFIGFSGHKDPKIHLEMLNKPFAWDAVMLPLGIMDYHFKSFTQEILPILVKKEIGSIGFKTLGGFLSGTPQKAGISIEECLRYSMSLPASTIVVGMEQEFQLKENIAIATNFHPMPQNQIEDLRKRTKRFGEDGKLEIYKTTRIYDGKRGKIANSLPPDAQ